MAIFRSLLATLRDCGRSRAILQLETLALRHQLQVLERSHRRRLRLTRFGPDALGMVLARRVAVAVGARDRQTRNRHQLASARVSPVLELEEPTPDGSAAGRSRSPHADPNNVDSQSVVGCPSHSRRVVETRRDDLASDRREIHRPAPTTTLAAVADLPGEPRAPARCR